MKQNATNQKELNGSLILVPESLLYEMVKRQDAIDKKQDRIITLLEKGITSEIPGNYIPEEDAKELLDRKTTWFWQMRSSGKLAFTKVGNRIFYAKADIQKLLDNNRTEAVRK